MLNESTFVRAVRPCAWQNLEEEVVIVQPRQQQMHVLNEVGAFLWQQIQEGVTIASAVDAVVATFEVERETAAEDVASFVEALAGLGLVAIGSANDA